MGKGSGLSRKQRKQIGKGGLLGLKSPKDKLEQTPKFISAIMNIWSYVGFDDIVATSFLLVGFIGYFWTPVPYIPEWSEFYHDNKSSLVGLGLTVLILGNADQYIKMQVEKSRLILQMGSPDNGFAREAVRQLRARGWLIDGTTKNARLIEYVTFCSNAPAGPISQVNIIRQPIIKRNIRAVRAG